MAAPAPGAPGGIGLGDAVFLPGEARLVGPDGTDLLRPRSAAVLGALVERAGRIVSKDELIAAAWPGPAVTDESVAQCISDIRRATGDRDRTLVETFPKRGYRLNLPARPRAHRAMHRAALASGALALASVAAVALALMQQTAAPEEAPEEWPEETPVAARASLAVLPFEDLGGGLLTSGFSEDLTTALAGLMALDVVPSATARLQDAPDRSLAEIAEALGARYLLDGSLRRHGDRLRVTAELIDAAEGRVVWAESYDGAPAQLFEFHDRVLAELAEALPLSLSEEESARLVRRRGGTLPAYEELLLGRRAMGELALEASRAAEKHFRRAIEISPGYARAHASLADVHVIRLENGWSALPEEDARRAEHHGERARALEPRLAYAEYVLGRLHSVREGGDLGRAAAHLRQAMRLAPGDDDARVYYAVTLLQGGAARQALEIMDAAIGGHPAPPFWYHMSRGHALIHLNRQAEAIEALDRCLSQMPTAPYCLRFKIVSEGLLGRTDDAEWTAAEYEALGFEASVGAIMDLFIFEEPSQRARLRAGLREAGLPEGQRSSTGPR